MITKNKYLKEKNKNFFINDINPIINVLKPKYITTYGKYILLTSEESDNIISLDINDNYKINDKFIRLPLNFKPAGIIKYNDIIYVASSNPDFSCIGKYEFENYKFIKGTYNFATIPGNAGFEGITILNNNIYCSDKLNKRIVKINQAGTVHGNFIENIGLDENKGIVSNDDFLYICNYNTMSIVKCDLDLNYNLNWFVLEGNPIDICVKNNILFITYNSLVNNYSYIAKYNLNDNTYNLRWRLVSYPYGCTILGNLKLFVASPNNNYIAKYYILLDPIETYVNYISGSAKTPRCMTQWNDYVYIANFGNNFNSVESSISRIHITNGTYDRNFIPTFIGSTMYINGKPMSITLSDDGNGNVYLWVLTSTGVIGRYQLDNLGNWTGSFIREYARNIESKCNDMKIHWSGTQCNLYMANYNDKYIGVIINIFNRNLLFNNYVDYNRYYIDLNNCTPTGLLIYNDQLFISIYENNCIIKYNLSRPDYFDIVFSFKNYQYPYGISVINNYLYVSLLSSESNYISRISLLDETKYNIEWLPVGGNCLANCIYDAYVNQFQTTIGYLYVTDDVYSLIYKQTLYYNGSICFVKDTPILTDQGIIEINNIDKQKHTIRGQKIVEISTIISDDDLLVCIEKDAIKKNLPTNQIILSRNHKIEYDNKMIMAKELLEQCKSKKIYYIKKQFEILYNILLETNSWVIVNGLKCETLNINSDIAKKIIN